MLHYRSVFPTQPELWQACILSTIANSFWVAADNERYPYEFWAGPNYCLDNGGGDTTVLTFSESAIVAALFSHESQLNTWAAGEPYDLQAFFVGIQPQHLMLAQQQTLPQLRSMQYVPEEYPVLGAPMVTAAFWGTGNHLTSPMTWSEIAWNGGFLVETLLRDKEVAIGDWQLPPEQESLLRSLYQRRVASPTGLVVVGPSEREIIVASGGAGIERSRKLLGAIGIIVS
jgi:hypothetical protein